MAKSNIPPRPQSRYERNFGNEGSEELIVEFLPKFVQGITRAERTTLRDDEHHGVDALAVLENGEQLAIQWTITSNKDKQREKTEKILKKPLTHLHDESGRTTSNERVPIVLLYADKVAWGGLHEKTQGDISNLSFNEGYELGGRLAEAICTTLEILSMSSRDMSDSERKKMVSIARFLRNKDSRLKGE